MICLTIILLFVPIDLESIEQLYSSTKSDHFISSYKEETYSNNNERHKLM